MPFQSKSLFFLVSVSLIGCSSTNPEKIYQAEHLATNNAYHPPYSTAQVINEQAKAAYLPEWLRKGERFCSDKEATYCAIACSDVKGDDYFFAERIAENLSRSKVLGYLKSAVRSFDDGLLLRQASSRTEEVGVHYDAVVSAIAYGVRTPETAYRNKLDKLQACSISVFDPTYSTQLIKAYGKIAGLNLTVVQQRQAAEKLFKKEFIEKSMKAYERMDANKGNAFQGGL